MAARGARARRRVLPALLLLLCGVAAVGATLSTALYVASLMKSYPASMDDYAQLERAYVARRRDVGAPYTAARHESTHIAPVIDGGGDDDAWSSYALLEVTCAWAAPRYADDDDDTASCDAAADTLLVFFVPGNAGSAHQGVPWSCAVALAAAHAHAQRQGRRGKRHTAAAPRVRTFAFDFAQQANVHRGRLVARQADYVRRRVAHLLRASSPAPARAGATAWLVGHSMGGLVARTAATLPAPHPGVRGVVTFNAPHAFPPLYLDRPMRWLYAALARAEAPRRDGDAAARPPLPLLFSLTSGEADVQIEPASTAVTDTAAPRQRRTRAHNMADARVCGHSTSHDKILHDPCALAFAAEALLRAAAAPAKNSRSSDDDDDDAPGPPPHATPPLLLRVAAGWGRRCVRQHLWPAAASAFALRALLHLARPFALARGGVGAVVCARASLLAGCVAYAFALPRLAAASPAANALALIGPVAAGVGAGACLARAVDAAAGAAAALSRTTRACDARLVVAAAVLLGAAVRACAAGAPAPMTRAALWLVLAVLARDGGGDDAAASRLLTRPLFARARCDGQSATTPLLATLFALQLQPFFVWQNAARAHTVDSRRTLDPLHVVVEAAVVAVLVVTWAPRLPPPLPCRRGGSGHRLRSGARAVVSCLRGGPARVAYAALLATTLAYVAAAPREACRLLPALLAFAPACLVTAAAADRRPATPSSAMYV